MRIYLTILFVALAGTASAMDRDDVLTMLRRGAREDTILLAMHEDYTDFGMSTKTLEELRNAGASDTLINAMTGGLPYGAQARHTGFLRVINNTRDTLYHGRSERRWDLYVHSRWKPDLPNTQNAGNVKIHRLKKATFRLKWYGQISSIRVPIHEHRTTEVVLQPRSTDEKDLEVVVRQNGRTLERRTLRNNVLTLPRKEVIQEEVVQRTPVTVLPPVVSTPSYTVRHYSYPSHVYRSCPKVYYYRSYRHPHSYHGRCGSCRHPLSSCRCSRSRHHYHSRHHPPVIIKRGGCGSKYRSGSSFGFSIRF